MTEESQFDSWQGQETFLLSSDQTGSGANPASCSVEISIFGGGGREWLGHEADHSPCI